MWGPLNGTMSLVQAMRFFDSLSDTSAYRVTFDLGADTKVSKWLTWSVPLGDCYVAVPNSGRNTDDLL